MSETMNGEQAVLDAFAEYWRANYGDGCVISSREWHLPKLQRAIRHALRPVLAAARREVETWQRKAGEQEMRAILAEREANEHSAALEDVRRVESFWSGDINRVHCEWEDEEGARPLFTAYNGCDIVASADSLEALGRALAQEAGDAK